MYQQVGWPLYKLYGHAHEAFRAMVSDADAVWAKLREANGGSDPALLTPEIKSAFETLVRRRMTPQPVKIRADVEMTCFARDGIERIKEAMRFAAGEDEDEDEDDEEGEEGEAHPAPRDGEASGDATAAAAPVSAAAKARARRQKRAEAKAAAVRNDLAISVKLVAPPLYVVTTLAIDKAAGIEAVDAAVERCRQAIVARGGALRVRESARAVSEREERALADELEAAEAANREVAGDDDSEEEEEQGMSGDVDRPSLAI